MTFKKALLIIVVVLLLHACGLIFNLYDILAWYDIPMHFVGGFAAAALGLAIWNEGIEEVKFKGWFQDHLKWWLVPGIILGFASLIGVAWELHEFVLDEFLPRTLDGLRQPDIPDTMFDFVMDLAGAIGALVIFWKD